MKRFLIATALTTSMSTAAFAATLEEQAQVEAFLPSVDASALTEEQMTLTLEVINSNMTADEKRDRMNLILSAGSQMSTEAVPTAAQQSEIQRYAPDVDFSTVTQAQVDSAMLAINGGGSPSEIQGKVQSILGTVRDSAQPEMAVSTETNTSPAMPTEAQQSEIERYAPGVDFTTLTQAQVDSAMLAINGGGSPSEIAGRVQSILETVGDSAQPTMATSTATTGPGNSATEAQIVTLQSYLPDMAVESLSEAELASAMAIVNGGGSQAEIQARLEDLSGS